MTAKQLSGTYSPDGSKYVALADGNGNLVVTSTSSTGNPKQIAGASQAPDGSIYLTLTNGSGTLV
jgi:hypothetical protein